MIQEQPSIAIDTPSPVIVRLSPDGMHLDVLLAGDATLAPTALADQIHEQSARLGVRLPMAPDDVAARVQAWERDVWNRLASASPASPTVNGQIELLVPVSVSSQGHKVRAGTALARLKRGTRGEPGRDLLGREVAAREPREPQLPRGENTHLSDDGQYLLAAGDGQVVLRNLRLHVLTRQVHQGDLDAGQGPIRSQIGVFVTGSVRSGARIDADGDVHVGGDVECAEVTSREGSIVVAGSVRGTAQHPSVLGAAGDVACHSARYAEIMAAGSLRLGQIAWSSTLKIMGDLYLQGTMASCLLDVEIAIGGAVVPVVGPVSSLGHSAPERQHVRATLNVSASAAVHGDPPLTFHSGVVADISTGGARFHTGPDFPAGALSVGESIQMKLVPPDDQGQMVAIARVVRLIAPGEIGVAFVEITQRDRNRLKALCRQRILARQGTTLGHLSDRKGDGT